MNRLSIDPEEMANRNDADVIASLNMLGEGAPVFDSYIQQEYEKKRDELDLPETYQ